MTPLSTSTVIISDSETAYKAHKVFWTWKDTVIMNPTPNANYVTPTTQPTGATGATTAPAAGYPTTHGHTKRDPLLGAGAGAATGHTILGGAAGHAIGRHGERHDQNVAASAAGATGAGHTAGITTHPSTLDKIEGSIEKTVGKLANNPAMVAQGQAKKTGGTVPAGTNPVTGVGTGPTTRF